MKYTATQLALVSDFSCLSCLFAFSFRVYPLLCLCSLIDYSLKFSLITVQHCVWNVLKSVVSVNVLTLLNKLWKVLKLFYFEYFSTWLTAVSRSLQKLTDWPNTLSLIERAGRSVRRSDKMQHGRDARMQRYVWWWQVDAAVMGRCWIAAAASHTSARRVIALPRGSTVSAAAAAAVLLSPQ